VTILIEINLTPESEIKSYTWFVPDLMVLLAIVGGAFGFEKFQIGSLKLEIASIQENYETTSTQLRGLSEESKNYYSLKKRLETIRNKIFSITTLTQNLINHYKPLLLLELIQTNRPEFLWLSGAALESRMIAVFIKKLKESKESLNPANKLLSQIYFSQIALEKISNSKSNITLNQTNELDQKLLQVIQEDTEGPTSSLNNFPQYSLQNFTDIKDYPEFRLNLKYDLKEKNL
jgi:hypothetical protein